MLNQNKGFTLIESLFVIGIIAILTAVVIIAINPARQFAQVRNTQRRSDLKSVIDAVEQYRIEHKGALPKGIDGTLRMIGTADSGCNVNCISQTNPGNKYVFPFTYEAEASFLPEEKIVPDIIFAEVEPVKVLVGDIMTVRAEIKDSYGIESVVADMGGIERIELKLKKGSNYFGLWEGQWEVHSTEKRQYVTRFAVINKLGNLAEKEIVWSDPSEWILPDGHEDPGNQWSSEARAYDDNTGTYSQNTYGSSDWGQFIVLTLSSPIICDRVRVNADYLNAHIREVDVDILVDGNWEDVFQGGDEQDWNCKWVEIPFTKGSVEKARFRYNYRVGGYYYWLYEFQFYETVETVSPPECTTQEASSVEEDVAIVHGVLNDDGGEPCEYRFQYGEDSSYGNNTQWKAGRITGEEFSELITGLDSSVSYHFRAQVRNSTGIADGEDKTFYTSPGSVGWVSATNYNDPTSQWEDETGAYDDNLNTPVRNYHDMGENQWSSFIYLSRSIILSDGIRFYARNGAQVSSIDLDVLLDGNWEDVFQGSFDDKRWVEKSFTEGMVSQVRVRFRAASQNQGFYWELYEFDFRKLAETTAGQCLDLTSYLTPDYLSLVPYDPRYGSIERTYYCIKTSSNGRIIVKACNSELGENIYIKR